MYCIQIQGELEAERARSQQLRRSLSDAMTQQQAALSQQVRAFQSRMDETAASHKLQVSHPAVQ